ncbi:hypothetical protein BCR34DRAFT_157730 [Clohesyomyces aquaticus]|uniref:Uncharacterized protein n=1 Tax=Clohesyomyces aquaticus TaxID=1231657 RepID=A0A1Y1YJ72_9PLEO|nr:hypothetical protein BCR34DRAFT_157730 [Clohesyomyces aquaticus]
MGSTDETAEESARLCLRWPVCLASRGRAAAAWRARVCNPVPYHLCHGTVILRAIVCLPPSALSVVSPHEPTTAGTASSSLLCQPRLSPLAVVGQQASSAVTQCRLSTVALRLPLRFDTGV